MKIVKAFLALFTTVVLLFLFSVPCHAQAATLPGYSVSLTAGYSLLTGAQNNNGMFSSLAVPLWTSKQNRFSVQGRGDWFTIVTPSTYAVLVGPEERFQFSRSTFLSGRVFQPFMNQMAGAARSTDATNNPTHFALKLGAGLDMPLDKNVTARLFEVDYIRSKVLPGGSIILSNFAQVTAGIGIHF